MNICFEKKVRLLSFDKGKFNLYIFLAKYFIGYYFV